MSSLKWLITLIMALTVEVGATCYAAEETSDTILKSKKSIIKDTDVGTLLSSPHPSGFKLKNFTWGAGVGSSVDLTGNNLSTFDVNIYAGYSNSIFDILGAGVGVQRSIGNPNSFVPIYALIRTNFLNRPSKFFFNLKTGYSFNTLKSTKRNLGGYQLSVGGGIYLKQTERIKTYILLAYGFYHINQRQVDDLHLQIKHIDFAQIAFGVTF